jgi:hypothetical protein
MASLLERLEVKPIPRKREGITIRLPKEEEGPAKVQVKRKRKGQYDRGAFMRKLAQRGKAMPYLLPEKEQVVSMSEVIAPGKVMDCPPNVPVSECEEAAKNLSNVALEEGVAIPTEKRRISVKKKGRLRLKRPSISVKVEGKTPVAKTTTVQVPRKVVMKRRPKVKVVIPTGQVSDKMIVIGDTTIGARLPRPSPPVAVRPPAYYMNNREIFVNFINSIFEPYRIALLDESKQISCDSKGGDFALLTHQAIVRDYMNLYTPYRGLLLYHGLGAGKTCASIAIAEGMKSSMEVVIMTPASLHLNYVNEIKKCGDPLYRLNQHWEWIRTSGKPNLERALAAVLSLPLATIERKGGVWFVDATKPPNYDELSRPQRDSLGEQLNMMIRAKYRFINYNGLRKKTFHEKYTQGGTINPFTNKVVVIDEAHNFVSRIVNKLSSPDSLSMELYEYLMAAEGCRVVFLTGTPIINYPNEVGIMFNMLRGYIKTFTFTVNQQTTRKVNQKIVEGWFRRFTSCDYVEYNPSARSVTVTRNPFGFVSKVGQRGVYEGVATESGRGPMMTDEEFTRGVVGILKKNSLSVLKVTPKRFKALPDSLDGFNTMFISEDTGDVKNSDLLKRRLLGMTSYFRSAREELMPSFDGPPVVAEIPMSDYQFGVYETARAQERVMELRNAQKRKASAEGGVYADTVSTYRIFSRLFCNFVFPKAIGRPLPTDGSDVKGALESGANAALIDVVTVEEQLDDVDGRHEEDDMDALIAAAKTTTDGTYDERIHAALTLLAQNAGQFLSPNGLKTYSPKFLAMLANLQDDDNSGLHLIYSQFRTLEGVGILRLILLANGFGEFRIGRNEDGNWRIIRPEGEKGPFMEPMFALYTGTEDAKTKELIRRIYSDEWEGLPKTLLEDLEGIADTNKRGQVIKILMITSSGAEGINLRNVRFVHIMEPYWHPVRVEQVIGRARRICSHQDLPVEERTIKVFMYLMKFTDQQLVPKDAEGGMASEGLLRRDVSKIDRSTPLTSDQALYEISNIKAEINKQLLRSVKESAIDCALHSRADDKEPLLCLSFGAVSPGKFTTTPALTVEREHDQQRQQNLKKVTWRGIDIKIGGTKYVFKPDKQKSRTGEVYDYDSYVRAVRLGGDPILRGWLQRDPMTKKIGFKRVGQ